MNIRLRIVLAIIVISASTSVVARDCVVLLHGLARSSTSMNPIEKALVEAGYQVVNIDYPSRTMTIEELAPLAVQAGINACNTEDGVVIHFVTHSLGGVLIRYYLENTPIPTLGRVVMLAPPNQGSEVVDNWRDIPGYELLNGPAGVQLGTGVDGIANSLGPVSFPLGVIAGNKTLNPILSLSLPNPDDGKVSVEKTKVEGMVDFIEVPHTHTFIMRADDVIAQVVHFLRKGKFRVDSK